MASNNGSLVVSGDGSFKNGTSSFAYIFKVFGGYEVISGGGCVDSHPLATSSLTGESMGGLEIAMVMQALQSAHQVSGTANFTVIIDNECTVKCINAINELRQFDL